MGFKNHIRHRGFVVEAYYENSRSVIATQRAFRTRFALGRNASVPDRKTILLWISNLRASGSTLKKNHLSDLGQLERQKMWTQQEHPFSNRQSVPLVNMPWQWGYQVGI